MAKIKKPPRAEIITVHPTPLAVLQRIAPIFLGDGKTTAGTMSASEWASKIPVPKTTLLAWTKPGFRSGADHAGVIRALEVVGISFPVAVAEDAPQRAAILAAICTDEKP